MSLRHASCNDIPREIPPIQCGTTASEAFPECGVGRQSAEGVPEPLPVTHRNEVHALSLDEAGVRRRAPGGEERPRMLEDGDCASAPRGNAIAVREGDDVTGAEQPRHLSMWQHASPDDVVLCQTMQAHGAMHVRTIRLMQPPSADP